MVEAYCADIEQRRLADTAATAEQIARLGNRHNIEVDAALASLSTNDAPDLTPLTAILAETPEGVSAACAAYVLAAKAHLAQFLENPLANLAELTRASGGESLTALADAVRPASEAWQARHFCRADPVAAEAYADTDLDDVLAAAARATPLKRGKMEVVSAAAAQLARLTDPVKKAALFDTPIAAMEEVAARLLEAEGECERSAEAVGRVMEATRQALGRLHDEHTSSKRGLMIDLTRQRAELAELVHRMEGTVTKIAARDAAAAAVDAARARADAEFGRRLAALEATRELAAAQRGGADVARGALVEMAGEHEAEATRAGEVVRGVREGVKMAAKEAAWAASNLLVVAATHEICPLGVRERIRDVAATLSRDADARCEACGVCASCRPDAPPECPACVGCEECAAAGLDTSAAIVGFDPLNPKAHYPQPADDVVLLRRAREAVLRGAERIEQYVLEEQAVAAADAAAAAVRGMTRAVATLVIKRKVELKPCLLAMELGNDAATAATHLAAIRGVLSAPLSRRGLRPQLLAKMAHADDPPAAGGDAPPTLEAAIGELRRLFLDGRVVDEARDAWAANADARATLLGLIDELAAATAREDAPAAGLRAGGGWGAGGVVWCREVGRFMLRGKDGALVPHPDV